MALLTTQQIQVTGSNIAGAAVAAAAGGDTVQPDARTCLRVINGDASPHTATIAVPAKHDKFGQTLPDIAVSVPAGEERDIGPLTADLADGNGVVPVTYDGVTSVTVVAFRV